MIEAIGNRTLITGGLEEVLEEFTLVARSMSAGIEEIKASEHAKHALRIDLMSKVAEEIMTGWKKVGEENGVCEAVEVKDETCREPVFHVTEDGKCIAP